MTGRRNQMKILSPERLDELTLEWEEAYTRGKAELTHKQFIAQAEQKNTLEQVVEAGVELTPDVDDGASMDVTFPAGFWQELKKLAEVSK